MRRFLVCFSLLAISLCGCGKYGPPLAPEAFSPAAVKKLEVKPLADALQFSWTSPEVNRRGRDLKSIDGYRIYRKEISKRGDIADDYVPYTLLASINDEHLIEWEKRRKVAIDADQPTHSIKPDQELMKFEYKDSALIADKTYVYRIAPFNQGSVEGRAPKLVKVVFHGESSEIAMIDNPDDESLEFRSRGSRK